MGYKHPRILDCSDDAFPLALLPIWKGPSQEEQIFRSGLVLSPIGLPHIGQHPMGQAPM